MMLVPSLPFAAATRRALLRFAPALALTDRAASDLVGASTPAAMPDGPAPASSVQLLADAALILACARFSALERQMLATFDGPDRIDDDIARDVVLAALREAQGPQIDLVCRLRATSLAGHRARAAAFAVWDGGETAYRAASQASLEDRVLAALVRDLAGVEP